MQPIPGHQPPNTADASAISRPRLIYDGDCGFCGYWARYWQKLTGDAVEFRTFQDVGAQYPGIPLTDFQRAVQYITPDGQFASGAEASFRTLSQVPGKGFWLWLYRYLPGFAIFTELAYASIAAARPACFLVS